MTSLYKVRVKAIEGTGDVLRKMPVNNPMKYDDPSENLRRNIRRKSAEYSGNGSTLTFGNIAENSTRGVD